MSNNWLQKLDCVTGLEAIFLSKDEKSISKLLCFVMDFSTTIPRKFCNTRSLRVPLFHELSVNYTFVMSFSKSDAKPDDSNVIYLTGFKWIKMTDDSYILLSLILRRLINLQVPVPVNLQETLFIVLFI